MPVINVTLIAGYDDATRQRLCERLTDAAMATIQAPAEAVTVFITEVQSTSYMRGRQAKVPGPAPVSPAELCLAFLDALGARELERAKALISDGFEMVFPGPTRFSDFADLMAWAAPRYRSIGKRIERVEEAPLGETVAVYVTGTLYGETPDGTPFEDIRFVDRFEVCGGQITGQQVWNDLAEAGVTGPG
ncbi:MAG: tautomerase family protein [Pseudomonadota bacterium]